MSSFFIINFSQCIIMIMVCDAGRWWVGGVQDPVLEHITSTSAPH